MPRTRNPQPWVNGGTWYGRIYHADGRVESRTLGLPSSEPIARARQVREELERLVQANERLGDEVPVGPVTVRQYQRHWTAQRLKQDKGQADTWRLAPYLDAFGDMPIAEVVWKHVYDVLLSDVSRKGVAKDQLGAPTIRARFGTIRAMFASASDEDRVIKNPCDNRRVRALLPSKKERKTPGGSRRQRYHTKEVELLISDERIPEYRQVRYCLYFLTGMRVNEGTVRRFYDYAEWMEPLGELLIASAWSRQKKKEGPTKTGAEKKAPVHATLAKKLAAWKLSGFQCHVGRPPKSEDFIIPAQDGSRISDHTIREQLKDDIARLGLPPRKGTHSFRRTFVSLCKEHGARAEIIRPITHAEEQDDMLELYSDVPWATRCEEVMKLRVQLREPEVIQLRRAVSSDVSVRNTVGPTERLLHEVLHERATVSASNESETLEAENEDPTRRHASNFDGHPASAGDTEQRISGGYTVAPVTEKHGAPDDCSTVALRPSGLPDGTELALTVALETWRHRGDVEVLRGQLGELLASLGGGAS